jgi:hypothetical protein
MMNPGVAAVVRQRNAALTGPVQFIRWAAEEWARSSDDGGAVWDMRDSYLEEVRRALAAVLDERRPRLLRLDELDRSLSRLVEFARKVGASEVRKAVESAHSAVTTQASHEKSYDQALFA